MKISVKDDYESRVLKTFIYQEMNKAGILFSSSMMIGYKHSQKDIDLILKIFKSVCGKLAPCGGNYNDLKKVLKGEVISPRTVRNVQ
jgi:hypothetical protein